MQTSKKTVQQINTNKHKKKGGGIYGRKQQFFINKPSY